MQEVVRTCIGRVTVLDLSGNNFLKNVSLLKEALSDFSVITKVTEDDLDGNLAVSALTIRSAPIDCVLRMTTDLGRRLPKQLIGTTRYLGVAELPALVYDCSCSPGYTLHADGECVLYWSPGRITAVVVGCLAVVLAGLAYALVPWYAHGRPSETLLFIACSRHIAVGRQLRSSDRRCCSEHTLGPRPCPSP